MKEVVLHSIIERPAPLYGPGDVFVGYIKTVLEFNDVRIQIAENKLSGYYIIFDNKKIPIGINGELKEYPDYLFDCYTRQLVTLMNAQ